MARRGLFKSRIAVYVARVASEMVEAENFDNRVLAKHVVEAVRSVGVQLSEKRDGLFRCPICGKGAFTKRGYYLHLTRIHYAYLISLVDREVERIMRTSKNLA
ncbi:MAG: hypothetical protein NZ902_05400 [Acidilobaceae archaeon]|nr:hypothetical protein [Acidilobaceae archaeon]MCX8166001.1 hypothetical protein [Acidilobaceae archaeon]MDW7974642.1 hypothetical protein [Sulfolobales archaeon]